ncbi:MAG: hypothetical protein QOH05_2738, partial [Acetobacteraceae bacterium]|nr:hypothetical protein [Acetobacteraceae bacterium]
MARLRAPRHANVVPMGRPFGELVLDAAIPRVGAP